MLEVEDKEEIKVVRLSFPLNVNKWLIGRSRDNLSEELRAKNIVWDITVIE